MRDIEVLQRATAIVGEGPTWDAITNTLWWVDILGCTAYGNDLNGAIQSFTIDRHLAAVMPGSNDGELLLLVRDGFQVRSAEGSVRDLLLPFANEPTIRFNDGKVDPRGRAIAGTMAYEWQTGAPKGGLYRLDVSPYFTTDADGPRATLVTIESSTRLSNGLGWSPDGSILYFTDSGAQTTYKYEYDLDTGTACNRQVFVEIPAADGVPDGLTVDDEGCVWIALHGAGAVRRFTPSGVLERTISFPVSQVTSMCFVGPKRDMIAVTSARLMLDAAALEREPLAGSVFVFDSPATGPAATPWLPAATIQ